MKKKNIVFFSAYHLPHLGGPERYTDNLGKELIKNGYNVIVVTSKHDDTLKDEEIVNGITVYRYPVYSLFKSRYPLLKKNKKFKKIINKLNDISIDTIIVNCRFYLMSVFATEYARKRNIPCYVIEHGSQHLTVNNKVLDYLGAHYEHFLTLFVKKNKPHFKGVSEEACKWQKHFGIESEGVWYNSIIDYSSEVKNINKKDDKIRFLYAGRIIKQKGVMELIKSFENLEKKYNNIELTIAGDGDYLEEIKKNTTSKNVCFLGKISFDELKKVYALTDILVYAPKWPEGLPTGILEAGISKCAVIGSPQGGIKEVILDNNTGLMINSDDELMNAMEKLINDEKLRDVLGNNLHELILKNFLWSVTAKKIINDIRKG